MKTLAKLLTINFSKMTNKILISFLLIIGSIGSLCAQDFIVLKTGKEIKAKIVELNPTEINADDSSEEVGYTAGIFVGGAMPLKSYASADFKNNEKASGAKTGFCAGLQVGYRTKHKLSFIFEGQYALNAYDIKLEDVRNIYTLRGDWRHIAALIGVRSEMSLSKDVSVYALSLGGLSFASVSGDFADVLDLLDTKTSTKSFAYSFVFGLILKKHITIGIRTINSNPVFGDYKQSAYNAQGTIGFQF